MATRFWVGGTGNWDQSDTTHWAATSNGAGGQSVPTASDDVTFDASSGGGTVTITETTPCKSITCGAFTGTLDTNDQTVNCTNIFSISGAGIRTVDLGASTINCATWTCTTTTNLTDVFSGATITQSGSSTFNGGSKTYGTVILHGTNGTIAGVNTFGTLTHIPTTASKLNKFILNNDQTVTGTLTISNGATVTNRIHCQSNTRGTQRTITAHAISTSNTDWQDIVGAGDASWDMSSDTGGSGNCGNNSMKALGDAAFTAPADQHWVGTIGTFGTGNWSTAANWTSRVPLPQDNVYMDFAFGTSCTVKSDMPRLGKSIDWTGATWTTNLYWTMIDSALSGATIFGSLKMITGLVTNYVGYNFSFEGRGTNTITSYGVEIKVGIYINAVSGSVTLIDDFKMTDGYGNMLWLASGTFSAVNGGTNSVMTVEKLYAPGSPTLTLGSATHIITGTSNACVLGGTVTASTGTLKFTNSSNSECQIFINGFAVNNIWISRGASTGNVWIRSLNCKDLKDDGTAAHTITFDAGTDNHVTTWNVNGTAGNLITITTYGATTTHNLIKDGGGTILCDYLDIQHSVATPANTWYARNSTNHQAVSTAGSGWTFITVSSITKGLVYSIKTIPSAITKGLIYTIQTATPHSITKDLIYYIKTIPSAITKSLQYVIKGTPSAITKSLKYTIPSTPSAITKGLQYGIKTIPTAITKGLQYAVKTPPSITKSLQYEIKTTPSAITKTTQYSIETQTNLQKGLQYVVIAPQQITKGFVYDIKFLVSKTKTLQYCIKAPVSAITKGLQYTITTEQVAITKSAQYDIKATPSAITKGLIYDIKAQVSITKGISYIVQAIGIVQKTLQYTIKSPVSKTLGLTYGITITPAGITKGNQYAIRGTDSTTKGLKYVIRAVVAAITKGTQYTIKTTPSNITKGLTYAVTTTPSFITKIAQYEIVTTPVGIQKGLQYVIKVTMATITKGLRYDVQKNALINKTISYKIRNAQPAIIKSLNYEVRNTPPAITKSLEYVCHPTVKISKVMTYDIVTTPPVLQKGLGYRIRNQASQTKNLEYRINAGHAITKQLKYNLEINILITKALQYVIRIYPYSRKTKPYTRLDH